jgi:hypothetical protein
MRKIEEHFCTYEQAESIIDLGYEQNFIVLRESLDESAPTHAGVLRSQALDFFRDKRYECAISPFVLVGKSEVPYIADNTFGYFIFKNHKFVFDEVDFETPREAESALIDKLIELEMEAQNGKP